MAAKRTTKKKPAARKTPARTRRPARPKAIGQVSEQELGLVRIGQASLQRARARSQEASQDVVVAEAGLKAITDEIREAHGLPVRFVIDTNTGEVREPDSTAPVLAT